MFCFFAWLFVVAEAWNLKQNLTGSSLVFAIAVDSENNLLVSSGYDQVVRVWDAVSGKSLWNLTGHSDVVNSVDVQGSVVVSSSDDNTARVWNLNTGECVAVLDHGTYVKAVALNLKGLEVVSGAADDNVRIWNIASQQSQVLKGHRS